MNESFEDQLRRALRPVDAPQGFTDRVLAALPERRASVTPLSITTRVVSPLSVPARRNFFMPAALAASLICAVLLGQRMAVHRDQDAQVRAAQLTAQRGREASEQLMQALRVTSQKLDIAYQAVNKPRAERAQENRS